MPLQNTSARYGSISQTLHWLTAILIFTVFPLGYIAKHLPYDTSAELAQKAWLFSLHKTLGVTLFAVALARILWTLTQVRPAPLHPDRRLETLAAETTHWLLYLSLVLMPLSGLLAHSATSGLAPIWWPLGQSLPLIPKSDTLAALFAGWHSALAKLLAITVALHVAGAAKHLLLDRDATLARMLPGTKPLPADTTQTAQTTQAAPTGTRQPNAPLALALSLCAVVIALGTWAGLTAPATTQQATPAVRPAVSPAVPSSPPAADAALENRWQVVDGTLTLGVKQFGNPVSGEFADWQAAITFDPAFNAQKQGHVTVDVAIASLTIGSVTQQALGFDFLDAAEFPTARFDADIVPITDGYSANGSLTLKGVTKPVSLPFSLVIDGDSAQMDGSLTLNRLDFGVGANMPDESTLGLGVKVTIALTAQRVR